MTRVVCVFRGFARNFVGIVVHPIRTIDQVLSDNKMLSYGLASLLVYAAYYTAFVAYGYLALNNVDFQYRTLYPDYPAPYYWETFMVLPLFLAQWGVLSLVAYGGSRVLKGSGTIVQTFATLGLAMFVPQFIVFALVDTPNALLMPDSIVEFATYGDYTGNSSIYGPPGSLPRTIADSYLYIALLWALATSTIAVSRTHTLPVWKALPLCLIGMIWILPVIILTRSYFILLW